MSLGRSELTDLYARYAGVVLLRCRAVCGNRMDADEALQETFLKAWRARARFDDRHPLAWLQRIAHNTCIDLLRRRKRLAEVGPFLEEMVAGVCPTIGRVEARKLLGRFDEEEAVLLRLRHIEGWDLADLATQFGVSRRTLSRRLEGLEAQARHLLEGP